MKKKSVKKTTSKQYTNNTMLELMLEVALRKIANSGSSSIIYGSSTPLRGALKSDTTIKELTDLLNEYISDYEQRTKKRLDP